MEAKKNQTLKIASFRNFVIGNRREKKPSKGSKAWVEAKRQRQIKQGRLVAILNRFLFFKFFFRDVRHESKYSGRKRKPKF